MTQKSAVLIIHLSRCRNTVKTKVERYRPWVAKLEDRGCAHRMLLGRGGMKCTLNVHGSRVCKQGLQLQSVQFFEPLFYSFFLLLLFLLLLFLLHLLLLLFLLLCLLILLFFLLLLLLLLLLLCPFNDVFINSEYRVVQKSINMWSVYYK
jgi:hypothetical protein